MKSLVKFGCAAAIAGACGFVQAATYVSDVYGDDDNNTGSLDSPYKTIARAMADSTDCVIISNGTYKLSATILPPRNFITFKSFSGNPDDVILDGQNVCRVFSNNGKYNIDLYGLTFQNGAVSGDGGGIYHNSIGCISNCVVRNCSATGSGVYGGGIYVTSASQGVCDVRIENCSAGKGGGGLYASSVLNVSGLTVTNCVAGVIGGGICLSGSSDRHCVASNVTIRGCSIITESTMSGIGAYLKFYDAIDFVVEDCHGRGTDSTTVNFNVYGGGVYLDNAMLHDSTVRRCSVAGGTTKNKYNAPFTGGGIYITGTDSNLAWKPVVSNCVVTQCAATNYVYNIGASGGGISIGTTVRPKIVDCVIANNLTTFAGGAVYCGYATDIENCTITNNTVDPMSSSGTSHGGSAVYLNAASVLSGCLIASNRYTRGVWDYNAGSSAVRLSAGCKVLDCAFVGNLGAKGVALTGYSLNGFLVSNCVFRANVCTNAVEGGVMWASGFGGTCEIVDSYFYDNRHTAQNGAIATLGMNSKGFTGSLTFRNCLMTGNTGGKNLFYGIRSTTLTEAMAFVVENCTIVSNNCSDKVFYAYHEGTKYMTSSNFFIRGSVVADNVKPAFDNNLTVLTNITYTCADTIPSDSSLNNILYDATTTYFVDKDARDFRPTKQSALCNKVPASAWMGTGSKGKTAPKDLGTGYEVVASGTYGVTVKRLNARPRLFGTAADIGCCEFYNPPGLMLLVR